MKDTDKVISFAIALKKKNLADVMAFDLAYRKKNTETRLLTEAVREVNRKLENKEHVSEKRIHQLRSLVDKNNKEIAALNLQALMAGVINAEGPIGAA